MAAQQTLTRLGRALATLAGALSDLRRPGALVGGLAVSALAEPRFTRDVDIAVAVATDTEAEELVYELLQRGFAPVATVEHETLSRLATVRLQCPGEPESGVVGDLLFASSGLESEIVAAATPLEVLPGVVVPVARKGHLLALKVLARSERRPQDLADIRALLKVADATDLALARDSVRLIVTRGYHRGRDLPRLLEEALAKEAG